jgi:hypothetical protein
MSHDSYDERSMITISEARSSISKMTTMESEIAAEIQLANLEYQHERRIIELKLKLNRAIHNGNATSVGTSCASKNLKIQKIYLTRTNFLLQMSEFKDGFLKFNLMKDKLRLKEEKLRMILLLEEEKLRIMLLLEEEKLRMKLLVEGKKLRLKMHKQRLEKEMLRLKKETLRLKEDY